MTKAGAITELNERIELIDKEGYDVGDYREALCMAISALTLKSPCSLCRFRNEDTGICDMCPAMPLERGAE